MIVTRLAGGLGNQMFQYAAGLSLAHRNSDVLAIDATGYGSEAARAETAREFGLADFSITAPVLSNEEAAHRKNPHGILSKLRRAAVKRVFRKYYHDWHPEVLGWKGDVYLDGYFQSERYFLDIGDRVRREFRLVKDREKEVASLRAEITAPGPPAVSLHVRRGDYVNNVRNAAELNICTEAYFARAVRYIEDHTEGARFFVFSDDPAWVKQHLPFVGDAVFVSERRAAGAEQLRPSQELSLMASCSHHIISNSTFSWWGAYLDDRAEKIIVAPKKWTNSVEFHHDNIVPAEWVRLET